MSKRGARGPGGGEDRARASHEVAPPRGEGGEAGVEAACAGGDGGGEAGAGGST